MKKLEYLHLEEIYFDIDDKAKNNDLRKVFAYAKCFQSMINNEMDDEVIFKLLDYKEAKVVSNYCNKIKETYIDDIEKIKERFKY